MDEILKYFKSSIGKKQVVAATGLALILFVVAHLAGNLIVYLGPDAFNAYAKKLAGLRPGLYFAEVGLAGVFLIHMWFTALIVLENINARPKRYSVMHVSEKRSVAAQLMPYTGTIVLAFVIWHLLDFTFIDKHGIRSVMMNGQSYGLYGVLHTSFANPVHSCLYIIAMAAVGLHLSHGVQSFCQTFGFGSPKFTPVIRCFSDWFALLVFIAYGTLPVYIMFNYYTF